MGKYKHEGKGRNISVGGGQERKDLFKDMSGGYNAMGDSNSPNYKYNGSAFKQRYSAPMELTAEGKKKILASDANPEFKSAIAKQPLDMKGSHSPMYGYSSDAQRKAVHASKADGGKGNPNKMKGSPMYKNDPKKIAKLASLEQKPKASVEGLNKKKTIKPKPKPKTTHHMYGELKDKKTGKIIKTFGTKPESPANKMKGSPMYKSGCTSGGSSKSPYSKIGDPNKKMDRLSARHKSLYDRFEMGQTSEAEEQRMYKLEDRMDKVGKKIKKNKSKNK